MLSSKGIDGEFVYEMPVAQFVQGVLSIIVTSHGLVACGIRSVSGETL